MVKYTMLLVIRVISSYKTNFLINIYLIADGYSLLITLFNWDIAKIDHFIIENIKYTKNENCISQILAYIKNKNR